MDKTLNNLIVDQIYWAEEIKKLQEKVSTLENLGLQREMRITALETLLEELEGSIIMNEQTPSKDPSDSPRQKGKASPLRSSPPRSNPHHQSLPRAPSRLRGPFIAPPSQTPSPFRSATVRPASGRGQSRPAQRGSRSRSHLYGPAPNLDPSNGGEYPPDYGPLPSRLM